MDEKELDLEAVEALIAAGLTATVADLAPALVAEVRHLREARSMDSLARYLDEATHQRDTAERQRDEVQALREHEIRRIAELEAEVARLRSEACTVRGAFQLPPDHNVLCIVCLRSGVEDPEHTETCPYRAGA